MKAVIAALAANLGIAITKFIAFLVTGSSSLLAESIHSVADTGNEILLLIGSGRSRRARTELHQFGFGRERYFYAFVVAVLLFTLGGVFSIYEGVHKIISREPIRDAAVAFVILGICVILESLSLRTAVREANHERGPRQSWRSFVHATKSPELPVVLLEDLAALLGLLLAFLGVLLSEVTGDTVWDGVGSVAIGALLVCAAFVVGYETKSLLIGESASAEVSASVVAALEAGPEGFRVIHLRTSHVGPDSLLVAAKVAVPGSLLAAELVARIDAAEKRVREAVPITDTIYLEPDIYVPGREDATDPSIQVVRRGRALRGRLSRPLRRSLGTAGKPPAQGAAPSRTPSQAPGPAPGAHAAKEPPPGPEQ